MIMEYFKKIKKDNTEATIRFHLTARQQRAPLAA